MPRPCCSSRIDPLRLPICCYQLELIRLFAQAPNPKTFFLSGAAAAGGIALINSIGNLAGFAGPYVMGWTRDTTGTYVAGLLSLSAACLMSVAIVVTFRDQEATETRQTAAV